MTAEPGPFPWAAYAVDAWQRSVIFLDVLRQRGNAFLEREHDPMRNVLSFGFEVVMDGRDLPRPVNYWMARITPPEGAPPTDPLNRAFIVIDPRAGHGPGIGGFKADSEIGVALAAGHPCYFVGFRPQPEPGQTIEDVVRAIVAFAEEVGRRHAATPDGKPVTIGNCQAGWALLMAAAIRPDAFGPLLVAGTPVSYWAGVPGRAPMRYLGGLLGGSWMTAMTGDIGGGIFDGAWLVTNFESGNPANTYWTKQYEVWSDVDRAADRYLGFEKWWGGHVELNAGEMQFIVDELFIGNRLATGELTFSDGTRVDLRAIASPIIVFCSEGDEITPPAQALSWITDLYPSLQDLQTHGQTIVYSVHGSIGHLGIFVSGGVAKKEHNEFASTMDMIDVLPPGLYEAVLHPATGTAMDMPGHGEWRATFEARDLPDLAKHGGTSAEDERRFAAMRRVSETNLAFYRHVAQPAVRALATPLTTGAAAQLHPARLPYAMFSDRNPAMAWIGAAAEMARAGRAPVSEDNPGRAAERQVSQAVTHLLEAYGRQRDALTERFFRQFYAAPLVQAATGVAAASAPPRLHPGDSPDHRAFVALQSERLAASMGEGGLREALVRALLWIRMPTAQVDERSFVVIRHIRARLGRASLPLPAFKRVIRRQFFMLLLDEARAIETLPALLPDDHRQRAEGFAVLRSVLDATGEMSAAVAERAAVVERLFLGEVAAPIAEPAAEPAVETQPAAEDPPAATAAAAPRRPRANERAPAGAAPRGTRRRAPSSTK
ncbi:DUF3141 domain-containing protein [Roseomonas terrae]|jgi:hypothetical protein|uniref:DUF3141 domain-containing protein n=1 Tax=Neoroseomonas terrae TaxID=424799 RepID=A0ABS5EPU1_9PROT|nr:DUF3141 domain-containing protein [Neoroseomonas terrae]MBR0653033.1 DUF3141 domain-containing protein [Neoroseomonas terrae]